MVATLALAPVSNTARDVVESLHLDRQPGSGRVRDRARRELLETLPTALEAPLGHGLGSAGEPTKLTGESDLRAPDNGYLSLMYQVGPDRLSARHRRTRRSSSAQPGTAPARVAPGQDLRLLLFAILVYMLVQLSSGDSFYGSHGVILWFVCGQVLGLRLPPARQATRLDRLA